MAESYKVLYQGQPGTAAATIYTVPGSTQAIVKYVKAVNVSAVPCSIKFFQGGLVDANCINPAVTLQPGESLEFDGTITMVAASTLGAQAGVAASITLTVEGIEVT